jgi:hypothetical protein
MVRYIKKFTVFFRLTALWSPAYASKVRNFMLETNSTIQVRLNSFDTVKSAKPPRLVKSHLHLSLLPQELVDGSKKAKIIYVFRNPKDVCVSFYHHFCLMNGYTGTMEDFVKQFITDNVYCAPYWTHLREFWEIRDRDGILFLKYEDMKEVMTKTLS